MQGGASDGKSSSTARSSSCGRSVAVSVTVGAWWIAHDNVLFARRASDKMAGSEDCEDEGGEGMIPKSFSIGRSGLVMIGTNASFTKR